MSKKNEVQKDSIHKTASQGLICRAKMGSGMDFNQKRLLVKTIGSESGKQSKLQNNKSIF